MALYVNEIPVLYQSGRDCDRESNLFISLLYLCSIMYILSKSGKKLCYLESNNGKHFITYVSYIHTLFKQAGSAMGDCNECHAVRTYAKCTVLS